MSSSYGYCTHQLTVAMATQPGQGISSWKQTGGVYKDPPSQGTIAVTGTRGRERHIPWGFIYY